MAEIEDAAHALEEEERNDRARKERRPAWTGKPSSHGKQEQGRSIRKRITKERRKVASRFGNSRATVNGGHTFQMFLAKMRHKWGTERPPDLPIAETQDDDDDTTQRHNAKTTPTTLRRRTASSTYLLRERGRKCGLPRWRPERADSDCSRKHTQRCGELVLRPPAQSLQYTG